MDYDAKVCVPGHVFWHHLLSGNQVSAFLEDANPEGDIATAHGDDLQLIGSKDPVRLSQIQDLCPNSTSNT
jgi:hypothetical protein